MKIEYVPFYGGSKSFSINLANLHVADAVFDDETSTWNIKSFLTTPPHFLALLVSSETEVRQVIRQHVEEQFAMIEWPDEETVHDCPELKSLLKAEIDIIRKHLNRHMWFQHISDEQLAAMDFAKKFGWVMKELYCLHACKKKLKCMHAMHLRQGAIEENPAGLEK